MQIYAFCPRCEVDISIKTQAETRSELEDEKGLYVDVRCNKCGTKHNFHVNRINAKVSPRGLITVLIVGIGLALLMTLILYFIGFLSPFTIALPIIIVSIYYKSQSTEASNFKRIRINRK